MNNKLLDFINRQAKRMGLAGAKSYEDLNQEEKDTYKEWEVTLTGRKLTDEDVKDFLENQLEMAISRLTDENVKLNSEIDTFRKVEVRFIKKIICFLNMPNVERTMIEKQIEQ